MNYPQPLAYTIRETSLVSGIGRTKLFEAIKMGQLQAKKFGNRVLVKREALESYLSGLPNAGAASND